VNAQANGSFTIALVPGEAELGDAVARMDFTKSFTGDLEAESSGLMLSVGDPRAGAAGYVAIEIVRGRLHDHPGGFAMAQLGTMDAAGLTQSYVVVPGSGTGGLRGITGALELTIEPDGTHRYELAYAL
jgi:hypothetical protein